MERWSAVVEEINSNATMSILVISKERTVLFLYQPLPALIGLVDSHSHGQWGALIALCPAGRLTAFCQWIYDVVFPDMNRDEEEKQSFEVGFWDFWVWGLGASSGPPLTTILATLMKAGVPGVALVPSSTP